MAKVRKTDPCPCGSGKKYKYCHGAPLQVEEKDKAPPRRQIFIWLVLALGPIAVAASYYQGDPQDTAKKRVWSEEHGHYHNIDGGEIDRADDPANATAAPVPDAPTTAPGPAPPGKVWSAAHGHWHDDANARVTEIAPVYEQGVPDPTYKLKRPDGPAPDGKVWSQAHGHWHDNDAP
jgi:hypothetical protein